MSHSHRLIAPALPNAKPIDPPTPTEQRGGGGGGDEGGSKGSMHPFIRGLVDTLPAPGTPWSDMEREEWLTAAKSIFALIYKPNRIALPGAGETGTAS